MKVLIADDHTLVRQSIQYVLEDLIEGVTVVGSGDLEDALACAQAEPGLDLILLDLFMPGMNGLEGLDRLRQALPSVPVVILTASESRADIVRALEHGARGFVPKSSSSDAMVGAIRLVLSGGIYVPGAILARPGGRGTAWPAPPPADDAASQQALDRLTPRQRDVLALVAMGHTNRQIGQELGVNETTVKAHVKAILRTLKVSNRTQAALLLAKRDTRADDPAALS